MLKALETASGVEILSLDCLDSGRYPNPHLVSELRKKRYICPACGKPVIPKVGPIRIPHFAHEKKAHCSYGDYAHGESEEHKFGKAILKDHFQKLYPDAEVRLEHFLPNGNIADVHVQLGDQILRVEYQRSDISLAKWHKRCRATGETGANILWVFSSEFSRKNDYDTAISTIEFVTARSSPDHFSITLNTETSLVTLKRIDPANDGQVQFKDLVLSDCRFALDGSLSVEWSVITRTVERLGVKVEEPAPLASFNIPDLKETEQAVHKAPAPLKASGSLPPGLQQPQTEDFELSGLSADDLRQARHFLDTTTARFPRLTKSGIRYGICVHCNELIRSGNFTYFDGKVNTGTCTPCYRAGAKLPNAAVRP